MGDLCLFGSVKRTSNNDLINRWSTKDHGWKSLVEFKKNLKDRASYNGRIALIDNGYIETSEDGLVITKVELLERAK